MRMDAMSQWPSRRTRWNASTAVSPVKLCDASLLSHPNHPPDGVTLARGARRWKRRRSGGHAAADGVGFQTVGFICK